VKWPTPHVRHVALFNYGESMSAENRIDGPVPVYGSNGEVGRHDTANTRTPVIVVGRKGSHGKLQFSTIPVFAIDTTYFIDSSTTKQDLRWLYYALSTLGLDELSNDVGVPGLSREIAYDLRVPLPSLAEQRAIADFLDRETARIDALITAKRRMIELLEERWQSVMSSAVSGALTHTGSFKSAECFWLEAVPSHWREGKLTLVSQLGSGHTPSRQHPEWWTNTTIPWITTGEVAQMRTDRIEFITETREMISELGMANSSATLHPTGTVVLCRTASAGYSAIMGRAMATSQDFATWTCGPLLRPRFLLLCLRAMRQDLLGRLAMGSTHQTIYMPDLVSLRVPLPPPDEQDRIVEVAYEQLGALDAASTRLGVQIDLLVERRQALITSAVTGDLDIQGAAA